MNAKNRYFYPVIALALILIDQYLKLVSSQGFKINLGLAKILFVQNTGIAFGLLTSQNNLLVWVYVMVLGLLLFFNDALLKASRIGFWLLLAGLTSNGIDRLFYGFVRDYIAVWKWPVFNIADACINIGALIIVYNFLKKSFTKQASD